MDPFNLAAVFASLAITTVIAAWREHWSEFGLLLGLTFAAGFALYMTLL